MHPNQLIVGALQLLPRHFVGRFARRYVAGSTIDHAMRVVDHLAQRGRCATIDVLGEELDTPEQVASLVAEYRRVLERIDDDGGDATLSVRLTGLGLRIDESLCWENLHTIAMDAQRRGRALTIDMEDSSTTHRTLAAYRRLREEGLENVGIVLQAYMRRTLADVRDLAPLRPRVRIVKGIWVEPYSLAFQDAATIRSSYVHALERLVEAGCYVEVATHDEWLVAEALSVLDRAARSPEEYEFQMLLGVTDNLADILVGQGHRVRVYVPYGPHWWEYCLRRLQENPQVARYVIGDALRTLTGESPRAVAPVAPGAA